MIIATAGHVDHGKTTLIRALTGTDCDRLPEEKQRELTIVLGYAQWRLPSGRSVSVIDVPGHEKLIRTMLSGTGGLSAILLVVSARSGVMPQTREHLNVAHLLGIRKLMIALTFADVTDDVEQAQARIKAELSHGPYGDVAIVPVSAITGDGLENLAIKMDALLADEDARDTALFPTYLPIDRVFTVDGHGTVVTGSLLRGQLRVGDSVCLASQDRPVRIRGLQVHGASVERVHRRARVAVNLNLAHSKIGDGDCLFEAHSVHSGRVFDAVITWLPHLNRPARRVRGMTIHIDNQIGLADVHALAPIAPGQRGMVRVRLDRTMRLPPSASFVLRWHPVSGYGSVAAGGTIIDPKPPRRRKRTTRQELAALTPKALKQLFLSEAGHYGLDSHTLTQRLPLPAQPQNERHFCASLRQTARSALLEAVDRLHTERPHLAGLPPSRIPDTPLHRAIIQECLREGLLTKSGTHLHRPGFSQSQDPELEKISRKLMRAVGRAGLSALTESALVARFPVESKMIRGALRQLIAQRRVIIVDEFCFPAKEAHHLRRLVARAALAGEPLSMSWLKETAGVTRKHAIPLWSWLDGCGVTVRRGDVRMAGPRATEYAE